MGLTRIIPAYAGSTRPARPDWPSRTDHPRIRGEHETDVEIWSERSGSSPHTRGAPLRGGASLSRARIIPAYAGSTEKGKTFTTRKGDHPRIRGEHRDAHGTEFSASGIIPAYAGSTRTSPTVAPATEDHPRIRGEHDVICMGWFTGAGSSPHTRGAHSAPGSDSVSAGIIPAYAGSTLANAASITNP